MRLTLAGRWKPRIWISALTVLMLCLSAFVLSQTNLFKELVDWMSASSGYGPGIIAALLLIPIVVLFSMIAIELGKGPKTALAASWTMVAPAILSLSNIDWVNILTPSGSGGHFDVALPSYVIVVVVVGLAAVSLCYRSYSQVAIIRRTLISRGIDVKEVDEVTGKMYLAMSKLALGATVASLAVLSGGMALSSLEKIGGDAFLPAAIAFCVAVLAAAIIMMWRRKRPSTGRVGGVGD